jgi:hypothetical protein
MFEMTYRTADGRLTRGGMAFDSPSHAHAGVYVTRRGSAIVKGDWDKMRKLVFDEISATSAQPGEAKKWSSADWAKSHARHAVTDAIAKACHQHNIDDETHAALRDLVNQHFSGEQDDEDKGKGAIDLDPDDEIDEQVRRYLKGKVDAKTLEQAIEIARRDRIALRDREEESAKDRLPVNALEGGFGGHLSGVSKDAEESFEREYPDSAYTKRDTYGVLDPTRNLPAHVPTDPLKVQAEKAASRTAGGGIGRRYLPQTPPAGDAGLAFDGMSDIEREVELEYGRGPGIGMFGR